MCLAVLRWTLWRDAVRVKLGSLEARSFSVSEGGGLVALRVCRILISHLKG